MTTLFTNTRGNVLFLILIAVALFAALSYAVTNSSRSGGDAARETSMIHAAQLTQFPAAVRASVMRLTVGGVPIESMEFNEPSDISNARVSIFHPSGGGSIYQKAPGNVMADQQPGIWTFNLEFEVLGLGNSGANGISDNELVAFLPNVSRPVCESINSDAEIQLMPVTANIEASYLLNQDEDYALPTGASVLLEDASDDSLVRGKPFGCFRNTATGPYVVYSVLFEQ